MKHAITPIASFGDIVTVVGFGDHLFAVDRYTIEYHYEPDVELCEVIYDLTCVYGDSGYIIGEQADITVVCTADKSEAYLRDYATQEPTYKADWLTVTVQIDKPKPPTDRRKQAQKQALVDELLDELNDLLTLNAFFGGKDFEYAERIARVTGKLKEVSGG